MRAKRLYLIVGGAVAVLAMLVATCTLRPERPSIILISIDTLRPDHLGCYGYARETSPNLDEFAREAMIFDNCFAQAPTTRPSCGSFLSGFHPHELKIFNNSDNLPQEVRTCAEDLLDNGYRTIGVVSNFVLRKGGGFDQGFELYDDKMIDTEFIRGVPERTAERTTDTAVGLLRLNHEDRFFMWVHYQDPHGPYTPSGPFNTMFLDYRDGPRRLNFNDTVTGKGGIPAYQRLGDHNDFNYYVAQYDGEIRFCDHHLKRLIDTLKALDLFDRVLIIITSDHGEGMGERDYYFAHGEYIYNNLIRVPLIVRYGRRLIGRRSDYVQLIDIVPTILASAGLDQDASLRGTNLLEDIPESRPVFSEMPDRYALIEGGRKIIYHVAEKEYLLFDLKTDPHETTNLIERATGSQDVRRMASRLSQLVREDLLGSRVTHKAASLTDDEKEKMRALGYVQ
jgi:arylsulfatase A-like enzyme